MAVGSVVTAAVVAVAAQHAIQQPVATQQPVQRAQPLDRLYVATWGHDEWPGTFDRPFATPERAQREVRRKTSGIRSDIVVSLRGGVYRLRKPLMMSAADSGRSGHRVVYEAYGREPVALSGGRTVGGWRDVKGVWRADVGGLETRQLYVNDVRARRAHTGKGLPGKPKMTATGYTVRGKGPQAWKRPQDVEFVFNTGGYAESRCGVQGVEKVKGNATRTTITMDPLCWRLVKELYGPDALTDGPTDIENSATFIGRPGDWYLDRSRPGHHVLLYKPRPGEDPRKTRVVAPVLESLVQGTGVRDVTFRGITFTEATWLAPSEPAGFAAAWSMYARPDAYRTVPGTVAFRSSERITLENNRFVHLGAQALELSKSSSHNLVKGNEISDISDGGILMGVVYPGTKGTNRGNHIIGNHISRVGVEYHGGAGIWDTATSETVIARNRIESTSYNGITSGPSDDLRGIMHRNRILDNRVSGTNQVLQDGGGIYLRGEQGRSYEDGALIQGNVVTDSRKGEFNIGIYTDDTSNWMTVKSNVVYRYIGSIGGCSEAPQGRPVDHVRYQGNFWDDAVPDSVKRRSYPGVWPPASDDCGDPRNLAFNGNTRLNDKHPDLHCLSLPACAAILANARR
jgi:hypothetical protein